MKNTLPQAAELVDLPDDAIPEIGLTIVAYLDGDGVQKYGLATHGNGTTSTLIGIMEMAKHWLIHDIRESRDEPESG